MNSVTAHPKLRSLTIKDLVTLMFIVWAGISPLRWQQVGVSDLDALRAELRRREWELA